MAANRNRRLVKEIQDIQKDKESGVSLDPINKSQGHDTFEDLTHFHGVFNGPPDTPYEGGKYLVDIVIPNEYPFKAPNMRFLTKIWHPNVSSVTGAICLDTLGSAWSPILTLKSALISLQSLLASPEPKDPQDAEVARMLILNPTEFAKVAKEWAVKYADAAPDALSSGSVAKAEVSAKQFEASMARQAQANETSRYKGYNRSLIDRYAAMGFPVEHVVSTFEQVNVDKQNGQDYNPDPELQDRITARLFGEAG